MTRTSSYSGKTVSEIDRERGGRWERETKEEGRKSATRTLAGALPSRGSMGHVACKRRCRVVPMPSLWRGRWRD
jgi:hypothetical protein